VGVYRVAGTVRTGQQELMALTLAAGPGAASPVRQLDVGDGTWVGRVDFAYPSAGVSIELDGRRYHSAKLDSSPTAHATTPDGRRLASAAGHLGPAAAEP
jgi:hypothetical protein